MKSILFWVAILLITQVIAQQTAQHSVISQTNQAHTQQQDIHRLSEQQKQKMLKEQVLLQQLSQGIDRQSVWKSANITQEQLQALQKKWKQQVRQVYEKAVLQVQQRERLKRQELQKILAEEKLTKTQQISHKETIQFGQRQTKFNPRIYSQGKHGYYRHHFNDYMFQLNSGEFDDFQITLVAGQSIALHATTYSSQDGVYSLTTDIEDQVPPYIQIYENSRFQIAKQSFYFKKFMVFQGKANTKYLIRMNNPGKARLFALSVVQIVDKNQVEHALTADDLSTHGQRTSKVYQQLKQQFEHKQVLGTMQVNNQNNLNKGIGHYQIFTIAQLGVVIGFCLLQIKLIERILSPNTIV